MAWDRPNAGPGAVPAGAGAIVPFGTRTKAGPVLSIAARRTVARCSALGSRNQYGNPSTSRMAWPLLPMTACCGSSAPGSGQPRKLMNTSTGMSKTRASDVSGLMRLPSPELLDDDGGGSAGEPGAGRDREGGALVGRRYVAAGLPLEQVQRPAEGGAGHTGGQPDPGPVELRAERLGADHHGPAVTAWPAAGAATSAGAYAPPRARR